MDWTPRLIFNRIRNPFSNSVFRLSTNPSTIRRLYGALFLVTSIALGVNSYRSIEEEAIASWLSRNNPRLSLWKAVAESRGLKQITAGPDLHRWNRLLPKDLSLHSAWWDESNQALWLFIASEEDPSLGTPPSPEVHLFSTNQRPRTVNSSPRKIGVSWKGLEELGKLHVQVPLKSPMKSHHKPVSNDPRLWIF